MILKRYILIFTLALISCAGTNYIHSISTEETDGKSEPQIEDSLVLNDLENHEDYVYDVTLD